MRDEEHPTRNPDFVREYEAKLALERRREMEAEKKARAREEAREWRKGLPWYAYTFGTKEHPRHPLNLVPALLLYLIFMLIIWFWFY